jgi:hypothetical protein
MVKAKLILQGIFLESSRHFTELVDCIVKRCGFLETIRIVLQCFRTAHMENRVVLHVCVDQQFWAIMLESFHFASFVPIVACRVVPFFRKSLHAPRHSLLPAWDDNRTQPSNRKRSTGQHRTAAPSGGMRWVGVGLGEVRWGCNWFGHREVCGQVLFQSPARSHVTGHMCKINRKMYEHCFCSPGNPMRWCIRDKSDPNSRRVLLPAGPPACHINVR